MSNEGPEKPFRVRVRSANLDAPTLVDRIETALLDHLCKCGQCAAVFADQIESIANAGCLEGMRLVSESEVKWAQRKSALALGHIAEETLDDYIFDRLTSEESQAVEHHVSFCLQCAKELSGREMLIMSIKAAFCEIHGHEKTPSRPIGVVNVRFSARAVCTSVVRKKENEEL